MSEQISGSLRSGRKNKFKSEINVVPYIDVMLVLLVIFMVVAPMTNPGTVDLPSAEKTALPPTDYIQISLRPDVSAEIGIHRPGKGKDTFESVPDKDALINSLQIIHAENPDLPVLIAADKNIIYIEVVQVISDAKKMGISRVGLATR